MESSLSFAINNSEEWGRGGFNYGLINVILAILLIYVSNVRA